MPASSPPGGAPTMPEDNDDLDLFDDLGEGRPATQTRDGTLRATPRDDADTGAISDKAFEELVTKVKQGIDEPFTYLGATFIPWHLAEAVEPAPNATIDVEPEPFDVNTLPPEVFTELLRVVREG